jgi:hypothetical protein
LSAWEELRSGELGHEFARLLYRCARTAGRSHNFPPPDGHAKWDAAAAIEVGNDFLTSAKIRRRLVEMALKADDDEQLRRVLTHAIVNFLRERARATATGRLIRRLKEILDESSGFVTVPAGRPGAGQVALLEWDEPAPFGGREKDLIRAAYGVRDVSVVRWSPAARREGPLADRDSLIRVSTAVLRAARASLSWPDLATVVATRFGIASSRLPVTIPVDAVDDLRVGRVAATSERPEPYESPGQSVLRESVARDALDQFTPRERLVLAWLGETIRTIADRTGLPVSTAGVVKQRVTDRLLTLLSDVEDKEAAAVAARDLAARELGIDIW